MSKLLLLRRTALGASLMIGVSASGGALAQDAQEGGLEEIIVTATKRAESLQDVPVSVSAVTGARIKDLGIQRGEELSQLIPNFSIQQDPIGDKINIRGIQSGNNAGLEQSISTFVDGLYRGRGVQARFAFLDVERIEVLRGPQGTLFGKNTIGGAVSIISGKPTDELDAAITGTYTFDNIHEYEVVGHVAGPITDTVRARVAGQYRETTKGHLQNIFYDESSPQLEEYAIRGSLQWDATPDTLVDLKIEYGDFDQFGQNFSTLEAGPLAGFGQAERTFRQSNIGSREPTLDIGSSGNFEGDIFEAGLTVTHQFDAGTLSVISGYSGYDYNRECDCDFSLLDLIRFDDDEDYDQVSLEVRFASAENETFDYIVGGYFQYSELLAEADTFFNTRGDATLGDLAIDTVLGLGCLAAGGDPGDRNCILTGLVAAFDGTPLAYTDFNRAHFLDQEDTVAALFGQATWYATDTLSLTGGLRYTYERKTALQGAFAAEFGTRNPIGIVGDQALYAGAGAPGLDPFTTIAEAENHENNLARTENNLTWSVNAAWEPTDDILVYGNIARGFKAGGYNSFALSADPAEAEYEDERALGFEIGSKLKLLDGAAELNFAGFYTDFTDIQTALFTGSTSFIVQNAASATSKGFEIDGRWAVTSQLLVQGGVAFVDFEFDDYPNAGCFVDQLFQFRADTGNPLATLQDCSAAEVNDLSGRTSENTPKWSGSLGANYVQPVGGDFEINTNVTMVFQTQQFRQADLDPIIRDDGFIKANMTIGFGPTDQSWNVALVAKNLFNARSFSYGNDTPLVDGARQFIPDRPRTIAVRAGLKF